MFILNFSFLKRNIFLTVQWRFPRLHLKYFLHFSVLLWKYFVSGVEIFLLWCGNFLFSFLSYDRNQSRKISTPVWKFFIFVPILRISERFQEKFLLVQDVRRNFSQCKMSGEMFSSPKYGIIFNSARCQEKSLTVQDVRRNL